ncbi:hypothetical protein ACO2RV_04730 [Ancylobacter sp. VNQ12]|uniref:hypothetical protein n=1 Tax=Ancylobacter sp. VNQ12 TaxID=3400920 RepID=UPI003C0BD925
MSLDLSDDLMERLDACGKRTAANGLDTANIFFEARDRIARMERREQELINVLGPFADVAGEGNEDYPDDTKCVAKVGHCTYYALTLGDFRRASSVVSTDPTALAVDAGAASPGSEPLIWRPASEAPCGRWLVTYRAGEKGWTRSLRGTEQDGSASDEWCAPDGRSTITHHSYAAPTHFLDVEIPELPAGEDA